MGRRRITRLPDHLNVEPHLCFAIEHGVRGSLQDHRPRDLPWRLIEVKSTTRVKQQHLTDVAIQAHVLERAGLRVRHVEIMHLNSDCTYPSLHELFVRKVVTKEIAAIRPRLPRIVKRQLRMLRGDMPDAKRGPHCDSPYECPFQERCFGPVSEHHVTTLYRSGELALELLERGVEEISDIDEPLDGVIAERQRRAVQSGELIVEGDLAAALEPFASPVAFLDFETVGLAIPMWTGCSPYQAVPVQMVISFATRGQRQAEGRPPCSVKRAVDVDIL